MELSTCFLLSFFDMSLLYFSQVCAAKGPRPRYPRVWKTKKRIGTISKSLKLVECVSNLVAILI